MMHGDVLVAYAALLEYCVWMRTRPQKTAEIRERARAISSKVVSGSRDFMRAVSTAPRSLSPSVSGVGLTPSHSDNEEPAPNGAPLSSLQDSVDAKNQARVADTGAAPCSHS
jgi:hypothetical protein